MDISRYPIVVTTNKARILLGTPFRKKSAVVRYSTPISSTMEIAFMLGNPLTGKPIAAEHKSADPYKREVVN
jgi:hypothetical protein